MLSVFYRNITAHIEHVFNRIESIIKEVEAVPCPPPTLNFFKPPSHINKTDHCLTNSCWLLHLPVPSNSTLSHSSHFLLAITSTHQNPSVTLLPPNPSFSILAVLGSVPPPLAAPIARRLSVSASVAGEEGLMSCVLPDELLIDILAERLMVNVYCITANIFELLHQTLTSVFHF